MATRKVDARGYVRLGGIIYHPRGWIYEHRWVVGLSLGRHLRPDEVVHHINGDKTDNRLENLQMTTQGKHTTKHNGERWPKKAAGRWCESFDCCVRCGKNDKQHAADGLCFRCYDADYKRNQRLKEGAIPKTVRDKAWSVDYDGGIWDSCRHCGRSNVIAQSKGYCQACCAYKKRHGTFNPNPKR